MSTGAGASTATWDWDDAARRAGVSRDGRLNMGAIPYTHPRTLIYRRADGSQEALSGPALNALVRRTASVLRDAGVKPGDRVAGLLGRRPASYAVPLATWQLGGLYAPLFAGFRAAALRLRIADAGVTIVVTDPANRASLAEAQGRLGEITVLVVGAGPDGQAHGDLDFVASSPPPLSTVPSMTRTTATRRRSCRRRAQRAFRRAV